MLYKIFLLAKKIFLLKIIFFGSFLILLKFSGKISASEYIKGEENLTGCKDQKFLITAYYSPLPGQKFYMRGDYMADIRLNGNGTNGADGTEVYMGLLAGPKGYNFGTKIVLPGLGIGTIHDRGGAILAKSDYHRIDIWMGKGESGLARALNWGIQFVDGKVCDKSPELDNLSFLGVSGKLPSHVEKRLIDRTNNLKNGGSYSFKGSGVGGKKITIGGGVGGKKSVVPKKEIFEFVKIPQDVGFGDEGQDVLKLQIVLKNIGFYRENPNGIYDNSTMEAVFNFQRENGVVESLDNLGAGHFGKNTRKTLEEYLKNMSKKFKNTSYSVQSEIIYGEEDLKNKKSDNNSGKIFQAKIINNKNFIPSSKEDIFSFGENISVKEIQKLLKQGKSVNQFGDFDKTDISEKRDIVNIS